MKTAKSLAVPGAVFVLVGVVFLVVGVAAVVPIVLLVAGAADLLVAAFFALKDPSVALPRDEDA